MHTRLPLEGHSLVLFAFSIVSLSAAIVVVSLRCFVRLYIVGGFGLDDMLMLIALVLFIGFSTSLIYGTMTGIGHHEVDFPSDMIYYKDALLCYWLAESFFVWSATFAKLSIAMALLRVTVIKTHRFILWAVIGLIISAGLLFGFTLLFECLPVSYFWLRVLPDSEGHCTPFQITLSLGYTYSVMSLFADLTLGILPIFLVWKLHMNNKTKWAVGGILNALYEITICTIIETGAAVIAGSLITLRPLFIWALGGSIGSKHRHRRNSPSYPLNSMRNNNSADPSTWRPDIEDAKNLVTTVTAPRKHRVFAHGDGDSSEEHLNPVPARPNHVNIQETITVTEET
ncbi:hypothetical protein N7495_007134 [Penicillium taxi]|uniref:uncharacterized protein n=1 Tax=Penicillium taxi TaxID=168475 RepID=UPI0025450E55|nr:uncharacterized protein N7495_007134 [Penicillium taxi]KAJ5895443.1 hypothetical protein N7495_007134 [Penicillium taxi]